MNMHGVDLHKSYATISVRNDSGKEVSFLPKVKDFAGYVEKLGPEDAVVLEASWGTFFWADRIESQGALCILIDALRFRIIRDSWNKTDRRDAANLYLALWFYLISGEVKLPELYEKKRYRKGAVPATRASCWNRSRQSDSLLRR